MQFADIFAAGAVPAGYRPRRWPCSCDVDRWMPGGDVGVSRGEMRETGACGSGILSCPCATTGLTSLAAICADARYRCQTLYRFLYRFGEGAPELAGRGPSSPASGRRGRNYVTRSAGRGPGRRRCGFSIRPRASGISRPAPSSGSGCSRWQRPSARPSRRRRRSGCISPCAGC